MTKYIKHIHFKVLNFSKTLVEVNNKILSAFFVMTNAKIIFEKRLRKMFLVCYKNKSYLRKGFVLYQEILEHLVTYEKVIHDFAANPLSTSLLNSVYTTSAVPGVERSAGSIVQVDVESVDPSVVGVHRHVPVQILAPRPVTTRI
jgi:hypothetical protein